MFTENRIENIAVLGSTGSIGSNTLELVDKLRHRFRIVGLGAGRNIRLLLNQVKKFRPKIVSLERKEEAEELKRRLKDPFIHLTYGQEGAEAVASFEENDIVVSAITGISGLRPTLAAVRSGKRVALANKESMVVAGRLILREARKSRGQIIPIDSEHSGIFQCLAKENKKDVKRVTLTASGGPFFGTPLVEMKNKTLEEALRHPRWKMGKKVTIDSATLMNKGLELIEARWLFGLKPEQLGIVIHPQSVVHSLVEMRDGSILAQISPTDMKIPIQFALTYPQRENSLLPSLDLSKMQVLEFYEVDERRFPLIRLARKVLDEGESFSIALNAANEVAVGAFLGRKLKFSDIADIVQETVEGHKVSPVRSIEDIFEIDQRAREQTWTVLRQRY